MPRLHRRSSLSLFVLLATAFTPGCALIDALDGESVATVKVFATHAGTPDANKQFPDLGEAGTTRVFDNDMGWQIALSEIYVTTSKVELVRCAASTGTAIEMFWGPCAEDFVIADDRSTVPLGAVTVDDGEYCRLDVTFGPYVFDPAAETHIVPENPEVEGNSIYIIGVARRGEGPDLVEVPFEVISDTEVITNLDLSTLENNRPVKLEDENYPRNLTVLKTYDTFFQGIDFDTAGPTDLEAAVLSALELDTRIYDGSSV